MKPISRDRFRPPRAALAGLLLAALFTLASPRRALAELAHPVVEQRLANGLRVVVCPDPSSADVTVLMHYDVGARDEPGGLFGLAHLVEHLMFTGSRHVGPNDHIRLLQRAGATNINGETRFDRTDYYETVPPDALPLALWLESDRLGYLLDHVDADAVRRERATVQNELRLVALDVPLGQVEAITRAELFPSWHPYHHSPGGSPASVGGIDLADVQAFVTTWYGPSSATLILTGKVEPAAAVALAQRYFGTLPSRPRPARLALPARPPTTPVVLHVSAGVSHEQVRISWVTPRYGAPGDLELDLAAMILLRRLQKSAVGVDAVAVAVQGSQQSMTLASVFEIRATVAEDHTMAEAFAALDAAVTRLADAVPPEELWPAQRAWYNAKLFALGTSGAWATRLASALQLSPLAPTYDGDLGAYAAISPTAVRDVVRRYLYGAPRVVTLVEMDQSAPRFGALRLRAEGSL